MHSRSRSGTAVIHAAAAVIPRRSKEDMNLRTILLILNVTPSGACSGIPESLNAALASGHEGTGKRSDRTTPAWNTPGDDDRKCGLPHFRRSGCRNEADCQCRRPQQPSGELLGAFILVVTARHGLALCDRLDVRGTAVRAMWTVRPSTCDEPRLDRFVFREASERFDHANSVAVRLAWSLVFHFFSR